MVWHATVTRIAPARCRPRMRCSRGSATRATYRSRGLVSRDSRPITRALRATTGRFTTRIRCSRRAARRATSSTAGGCALRRQPIRAARNATPIYAPTGKATSYATHITAFNFGRAPGVQHRYALGIAIPARSSSNHAIHLKAGLLGPNGTRVQLDVRRLPSRECWRINPGGLARRRRPQSQPPSWCMTVTAIAAGRVR